MKDKKLFIATFLTIIALSIFSAVLVHAIWYAPDTEIAEPTQVASTLSSHTATNVPTSKVTRAIDTDTALHPASLSIPAINVNAKVQEVGITTKGNMGVPTNFTDVGWYKYGALPGDMGSAVIAGHVDNGLAFPGVFKHLEDLSKGDDVYVTMSNGEKVHFIVTDLAIYDYNADATQVFSQNDDRYLKLITCTGVFVKSYGTHDKRLVVTAVKVS